MDESRRLVEYVPESCEELLELDNVELRTEIPELARDWDRIVEVESAIENIPTNHAFHQNDSRDLSMIDDGDVQLVVTSPPYFNIKEYNDTEDQLGHRDDYENFLDDLRGVWEECYNKLRPGGRMCVVTGDILQSRREYGRHQVLPLHSSIQEQCREVGFDSLAPIIWAKIGNASLEAGGNARFLGKPYEPGAVIKNDIEYILMFRKPGGYRSPSVEERILSTIQVDDHKEFFQQIWTDVKGESRSDHPAPYPPKLAERLIRMFSFVGDTVLDPFAGSGSTAVAASKIGRDSINVEVDPEYLEMARNRVNGDKEATPEPNSL